MTTTPLRAVSPLCSRTDCADDPKPGSDLCTRHDQAARWHVAQEQRQAAAHAAEVAEYEQRDRATDRAALLALAGEWNDLGTSLLQRGMPQDAVVPYLCAGLDVHVHPDARRDLVFLWTALVDACCRLSDLHAGALHPSYVVHGTVWTGDRIGLAERHLQREVDEALHPLLVGTRTGA